MKLVILFLLTLLPLFISQSCTTYTINQSCYDAGAGNCCSCWGSPYCDKKCDYCCGDCGGCNKTQSCCSRGAKDYMAICMRGYRCCQAFTWLAYYCPSDYECCGDGVCCKTGTELAGWVIALVAVCGVCILASIALWIFKWRRGRTDIEKSLIRDHMQ